MTHPESAMVHAELSSAGRTLIVVCAFLGWLCAGFHLAITSLAMQPAAIELLARNGELDRARYEALNTQAANRGPARLPTPLSFIDARQLLAWKAKAAGWVAWLTCAFLIGAATGGLVFGRLGDRIGRSKAMAFSILTYSSMSAAASMAHSPVQLMVLWYLACTGVGGMWPNGVALISEACSSLSRPLAAGLIGTSANIGLFLLATLAKNFPLSGKSWPWVADIATAVAQVWPLGLDASFQGWRWMMVVGAAPLVLGVFALLAVPESPRWLASQRELPVGKSADASNWEIFRPPLLKITLIGIALATIPLIGGWGSANWMSQWAGDVGAAASPPNLQLMPGVQQARAFTGSVGSLLGGWIGSVLGRRRTYFLVSLTALAISQYTFWFVVPTDRDFLYWVSALGFFSGIYFGWLPLCLPELFPTRVRSTGAGVSFNFGRILTAVTVFVTGVLTALFKGDYAQMGRVTSLIFALGMIVIIFAPETSQKQLED